MTIYREDDDKPVTPVVLLKFGQLEHLQDLLENGTLYINSIQNLRDGIVKNTNDEEPEDRYDSAEGASKYTSVGPGKATLGDMPINYTKLSYFDKYEKVLGNICSFYAITLDCFENNELIPVDLRMKKFGPCFILIHNYQEFVERIDKAIENTIQMTWWKGFVKYFDEDTYNGELHLFRKRSRFTYQKEFRTYFETGSTEPIKVNLGSLKDIATIISSEALEHIQVKIDPSNNKCSVKYPIMEL